MRKVGIWGVNGFAGEELKKILSTKRQINIVEITRNQVVKEIVGEISYAILALPAHESLKIVPKLLKHGIRVIDMSGAFRLKDTAMFEKYYGLSHSCPQYLEQAVYGLTEKNFAQISQASLVANPGCYATAVELALLPLVELGLIPSDARIHIEAISGYSGAGKRAQIPDKVTAYKPNRTHQHVPEIEQVLGLGGQIHFYPHIAPWSRGIEATIRLNIGQHIGIVDFYVKRYLAGYVQIGETANMGAVIGTNLCQIAPKVNPRGEIEISVVIDNLGKGAAGQAVQNLFAMDPSLSDKIYEN